MIYKLSFILKVLVDAAVLPYLWWPLPLASLLFYALMVKDASVSSTDSQHFTDHQVPKNYCEVCHLLMFYRMKHCQKCQRCIHRYDHHCLLLEVCIGEFNHRWYVLFLPTMAFTEGMAIWASLCYLPGEVVHIGGGIEELRLAYYLLVLNIFLGLAVGILCIVLFYKHLHMIAHGTTSW